MSRDGTAIGLPESAGAGHTDASRHVRGLVVNKKNLNHVAAAVQVRNATGGALSKGDLVYQSGFHAATDTPQVSLADADSAVSRATHVLIEDIANGANGYMAGQAVIDGLNTNGQTIGDAVYLSGTAGEFVFAALSGAGQLSQVVGLVEKVDVTDGFIRFFPALAVVQLLAELQALSVGGTEIEADSIDETKLDLSVPITLALPFTLDYRGGPAVDGVLIGSLTHQAVDACVSEENAVGFTDETTDANSVGANDVTMPDPMNTEDALYVGMVNKFSAIKVKVGTAGASTGDSAAESLWEYSQGGSSWASLEATAELIDDSVAFEAGTSEYIVSFIPPADWAVETVNAQGPFFYVRLRATGDDIWDTTQPLLSQLWALELNLGQGVVCPMAGTISAIDMAAFVASAANDDSEFLLINLTTGLFEQFTWTGADAMDRVTGLTLAVSAGDQLVLQMLVDDGTTEFADGQMILQLDY